mgnify:CR=1 FL=1
MEDKTTNTSTETQKLFAVDASERATPRGNANLVVAVVLIGLGVLLLAGQLLHVRGERFFWPFFIIAPGAALLIAGLGSKGKTGEGLAITGCIVTAVGVILFYQNLTNHWQSWAYAWALVGPTAAGLGQLLYGALKGQPALTKSGWETTRVGLILFAAGFVFFELIIGISGFGLGSIGWPIALIAVGVILVIYNLLPRRRKEAE